MKHKNLCIFGASGAAKDVFTIAVDLGLKDEILCFLETDDFWTERELFGIPVKPVSDVDLHGLKLIIALGNSESRKKVAELLPPYTEYFSLIHPSAIISQWVELGEGCIVSAGSILTADIKIGRHAYINVATTITHDCNIGDYFTASPAVNISGNSKIGDCVFLGTNASVKEKVTISDQVIVGMGATVVKDLTEPGIYIGTPAKKAHRK